MTRIAFYAAHVRPYHVALAQRIATTHRWETDRAAKLSARFAALPSWQQTLCRIEFAACRAGKRDDALARIQ